MRNLLTKTKNSLSAGKLIQETAKHNKEDKKLIHGSTEKAKSRKGIPLPLSIKLQKVANLD